MNLTFSNIKNVLTRTSGYLKSVTSHSLQPYRGCSFGKALCGVGCYVQHNRCLTRGETWGEFLEVRENAATSYAESFEREARWARRSRGDFSIFLSSSTEPFLPQEFRFGITRGVLEAMLARPPDRLFLQTHSHRAIEYLELLTQLREACDLRVHVSIETDREEVPGLPSHASSVARRFATCKALKEAGVATVITVSPLLPIALPDAFFARVKECADAVVLDHFILGDGSPEGRRTRRTPLAGAIEAIDPEAGKLSYRDAMVQVATRYLPGRVGVNVDGFAGRYL